MAHGDQVVKPSTQLQNTVQTANDPSVKPNTLTLSWSDIETLSKQLIQPLKGTQWKGILAITRGGLIPAGLLADSLNIRRIETINIESYDKNKKRGAITFLSMPNIPNSGDNWLIVDDLVDSGETLRAVRKLFPKAVYVALIAKPKGLPTVDHHVQAVDQKVWVVFRWEND
jgi:xanthine phosphoribosyltransferase